MTKKYHMMKFTSKKSKTKRCLNWAFWGIFKFSNPDFFVIFGFPSKQNFFLSTKLLLYLQKQCGVHSVKNHEITDMFFFWGVHLPRPWPLRWNKDVSIFEQEYRGSDRSYFPNLWKFRSSALIARRRWAECAPGLWESDFPGRPLVLFAFAEVELLFGSISYGSPL